MKDIRNFEGLYAVTSCGKVWSYKSQKFLSPCKRDGKRGYLTVILYKDGKGKNFYVHRLVAEAYIPNPDNLPQVNHKSEKKEENWVGNLEWTTAKQNNNYGSRNERAAISRKKPIYCVELNRIFDSQTDAARELGLWQGNIGKCLLGKQKTTGGYHFQFV